MRIKKIVAMFLVGIMSISLVACGGEKKAKGITDEQLKEVVAFIALAEVGCDSLASHLIENWTTYSDILYYHYDEEAFLQSNLASGGTEKKFEKSHELRGATTDSLNEAKKLLGTEGEGEFYDAVKAYYLEVNNYLDLLTDFPDGYSKMTFSNAVSDMRSKCQSAQGNVDFYVE